MQLLYKEYYVFQTNNPRRKGFGVVTPANKASARSQAPDGVVTLGQLQGSVLAGHGLQLRQGTHCTQS